MAPSAGWYRAGFVFFRNSSASKVSLAVARIMLLEAEEYIDAKASLARSACGPAFRLNSAMLPIATAAALPCRVRGIETVMLTARKGVACGSGFACR